MSAAKTRFEKVSLEDLKKILPEVVSDKNNNHKGKKKDKGQVAKTSNTKAKA